LTLAFGYLPINNASNSISKVEATLSIEWLLFYGLRYFYVGLDYEAMERSEISTGRFGFRTTGNFGALLVCTKVGAKCGKFYGAAGGFIFGGSFIVGEMAYDGFSYMTEQIGSLEYRFSRAIHNLKYPM